MRGMSLALPKKTTLTPPLSLTRERGKFLSQVHKILSGVLKTAFRGRIYPLPSERSKLKAALINAR